ncbi:MAG: alpha-E domain-containing protein [Magnetococcales bacterium]|nr:alpha-E domain-containing protein [Magnetococcales bacterium]NGZ27396.1 alpha-E domain-containing protein [Magnetococcales bacterium]
MLSRIAANVYWMARYLERAENTARLVSVTSALVLDMPGGQEDHDRSWTHLVTIVGGEYLFSVSGESRDEKGVCRFLLSREDNPSSLISAIEQARENLRTMRDHFPREFWENLNTLHGFLKQNIQSGIESGRRHDFLDEVVRHCQVLVGILIGTSSRDTTFDFFRMGQHLERADMNTRILDLDPARLEPSAGSLPWIKLLRSVSAEQMYRRHVHPRVSGPGVLGYLLQDRRFPRSLNYCLREVERCLATLDNNALCIPLVKRMEHMVDDADMTFLLQNGPGNFMDVMQQELCKLHNHIAAIYFAVPPPSTSEAAQFSCA